MAKLLILESSFDATPQAVNDALIGSWKLLVASDADGVRKCGLAGVPSSKYERACRVVGHFQSFRQPDPMDILNGKADQPLLATTEVAIDTKDGSTFSATVEGGFAVGSLSSSGLDVVEYYSARRPADGYTSSLAPNSWSCVYISDTLRSCKMSDGSRRVYAKVDADAAAAEIARLSGLTAAVDSDMVMAWKLEEAAKARAKSPDEEEDDPDDNRPAWQKRIDKADGIKRTKNGTPILQ